MSDLKKIIDDLKADARTHPQTPFRHTFERGLRVAIIWDTGLWRIGIWRERVMPSPDELAIVRKAAEIPEKVVKSDAYTKPPTPGTEWIGYALAWVAPAPEESSRTLL